MPSEQKTIPEQFEALNAELAAMKQEMKELKEDKMHMFGSIQMLMNSLSRFNVERVKAMESELVMRERLNELIDQHNFHARGTTRLPIKRINDDKPTKPYDNTSWRPEPFR